MPGLIEKSTRPESDRRHNDSTRRFDTKLTGKNKGRTPLGPYPASREACLSRQIPSWVREKGNGTLNRLDITSMAVL
jgi:hypothetical protein